MYLKSTTMAPRIQNWINVYEYCRNGNENPMTTTYETFPD